MKLTNRDKFILTAVIVVVILILGAVFVIKPRIAEVNSAKATLTEMKQKKIDTEAKLNTLEGLKDQLKELSKTVDELQSNFYDEMETYETDLHIREILAKSPIDIVNVEMVLPQGTDFPPYIVRPANVPAYDIKINSYFDGNVPQEVTDAYNQVVYEAPVGKQICLTSYTVTYHGEIPKLIKALDELDKDEKTLFVYSCAGGTPKPNEQIESTITIYVLSTRQLDIDAIDAEE